MNSLSRKYIRVIPKLDIKGPSLVKGIHLEGLRVLGNPEDFAQKYYEDGADELIYIDLVASLYRRNNLVEIVRRIAGRIFIPLTVGGGVRTIDDMHGLLRAGADKIAVNTALFEDLELLEKGAHIYGSQCMVVYIEAKKNASGQYECMHTNARENSGIEVLEWIETVTDRGAGEIFLTFVDTEGTGRGIDTDFLDALSTKLSIPLIVNGGYGNCSHIIEAAGHGADAVAAASVLHYNEIERLKNMSGRLVEGNTAYIDHKRSETTGFLKGTIEPAGIEQIKQELCRAGLPCRKEKPNDLNLDTGIKAGPSRVVVVDYEMGNIFSLCRALEKIGANVVVTQEPGLVSDADYVILPGVGAFPRAMKNLCAKGLDEAVLEHAAKGRPLLGICLGMQLMFSQSDEISPCCGLDIIAGEVRFLFSGRQTDCKLKLPHIGWNTLEYPESADAGFSWDNTIFSGIRKGDCAYFVHSYAVKPADQDCVLAATEYGTHRFCCAVQKDNIAGCQFHPELSATAGLGILKGFLEMK